jgi:hypothetical protein
MTACHVMKAYWGSASKAPHIIDLGTRWLTSGVLHRVVWWKLTGTYYFHHQGDDSVFLDEFFLPCSSEYCLSLTCLKTRLKYTELQLTCYFVWVRKLLLVHHEGHRYWALEYSGGVNIWVRERQNDAEKLHNEGLHSFYSSPNIRVY